MWNIKGIVKNRISGEPAAFMKEDIKSLFSTRKTTTLGFTWYFLGRKQREKQVAKYLFQYYDPSRKCFDFNGIIFSKAAAKETGVNIFFKEISDILTPYLGGICDYTPEIFTGIGEGPYEHKEIVVSKGDVVVDAGANIGVFSALAAKKIEADSGGAVHAFEPVPYIFKMLEKTARANCGIKTVPLALSDSIGEVKFSSEYYLDASIISPISDKTLHEKELTDNIVTGKTTTLDDYANDNNLTKLDFIKADIEGAERLMLKGAKGVLKDFAPKLALCTYHLPDDPEVMRDLILSANDKYMIYQKKMKLYAFVPK